MHGVEEDDDRQGHERQQEGCSQFSMREEMAACLRSDKPIADCRNEAMKYHQQMMGLMGKDGCPMMDSKQSGKAPQK